MDYNELISMVTEGLSPEQAATVKAAIERDAVKTKVSSLKAQTEYEALVQREQKLQAALEGGPGTPGARAYETWYNDNYAKVQQLQQDYIALKAKYGNPDGGIPPTASPTPSGKTYTEDDIARMVDARIQGQYAPKWSELLTGTGKVVQKHMFAGRKTPIDFDELSKLAAKHNNNLEAAYDEWDRPAREAAEKDDREKEIKRRVDEEIQRRGASQQFPSGADFTPGSLTARSKADVDKFNPAALRQDLARTFMSGVYPGETSS